MLCKCSGKYIDIYFSLKITFFGAFVFFDFISCLCCGSFFYRKCVPIGAAVSSLGTLPYIYLFIVGTMYIYVFQENYIYLCISGKLYLFMYFQD